MKSGEERIDAEATLVTQRQWLWVIGLAGLLVSLVMLIAACAGLLAMEPVQGLSFLLFVGATSLWMRWRKRQSGKILVDAQGISFDGTLLVERAKILAVSIKDANGCSVSLVRRGWRSTRDFLEIEVADPVVGRALAKALAPLDDGSRFTMLVMGVRKLGWKVWGSLALVQLPIVLLVTRYGWAEWVLPSGSVTFMATLLASTYRWISVGDDGVHIREVVGGRRFIPFGEIASVSSENSGLILTLRSGKRSRVAVSGEHRLKIEAKIREGLGRFVGQTIPHSVPNEIQRRDQSTHAWLTSLRSIGSSSTTKYRVAATSPDDLARVLTDQSADVAARVAAAVALDAIDPNAALRIREVASNTANPKLRVALDRVADHAADAEIEASLDALSQSNRA